MQDWMAWHDPYGDPGSPLSRRLEAVQQLLRDALARSPFGSISVISMCAGQGRDLLGVLTDHPRRRDVRALLVEWDERNVAVAVDQASTLESEIEVKRADAGASEAYRSFVPAETVLICGVFGNITDADIETTIDALPSLCAADATVIWTRHRRPPDLTPQIQAWFERAGFSEEAFIAPADTRFSVGAHRFRGTPRPYEPMQLFRFVGYDRLGPAAFDG